MNSRQLEEQQELERDHSIAAALGITVDELQSLDWSIDDDASDDGLVYSHIVSFEEGSDPEVLEKIQGLQDGRWVRISPLA